MSEGTAQSAETGLFPLELTFERDHTVVAFADRSDFIQWKNQELQFWNAYAGNNDAFTAAFRENITFLQQQNEQNEDTLKARLPSFQKTYVPSLSAFVKAATRFSAISSEVSRMALSLFLRPGQRPVSNSQDYQQAQALVVAYQAVGDPLADRDRIEAAVADAERLQKTEATRAATFDEFMNTVDQEFKTRFDGYEAKLALGAPREYWETRSKRHELEARRARNRWRIWTALILLFSLLLATVLFTAVGDAISLWLDDKLGLPASVPAVANSTIALGALVKKAIVFATFFGIGIWWLRQVLRDLRSHEHLSEDAAERVTMIETLSALKGAGLADGDLSPIFAALYRPAATGLVMDDGGGPISPWEVLFKAAEVSKLKT